MSIKTSILNFELKILSRNLQKVSIIIMNTKKEISFPVERLQKVEITLYVLYSELQFVHFILTSVFNKYFIYFVIY